MTTDRHALAVLLGADAGALSKDAQQRFLDDVQRARERQQAALDAAIEHGLRMVPMLLRGPLKRILFP